MEGAYIKKGHKEGRGIPPQSLARAPDIWGRSGFDGKKDGRKEGTAMVIDNMLKVSSFPSFVPSFPG
jgi:hypothetical protein